MSVPSRKRLKMGVYRYVDPNRFLIGLPARDIVDGEEVDPDLLRLGLESGIYRREAEDESGADRLHE